MSTALNKAIEEEADLLVAFVNSLDLEEEADSIATPELLADWITERTGDYLPVP